MKSKKKITDEELNEYTSKIIGLYLIEPDDSDDVKYYKEASTQKYIQQAMEDSFRNNSKEELENNYIEQKKMFINAMNAIHRGEITFNKDFEGRIYMKRRTGEVVYWH